MKAKLSKILVALLIIGSILGPATALAAEVNETTVTASKVDESIGTRAEESQWVYKIFDGWLQKRLWSNTYGYWKTDWIKVRPA